ncbi:hypothetical protein G4B88_025204 [Cannabis sativa]|uniref:RING-type domain-containing protein n=1 Tax=Cannabis sativa TaxID=3483 RepID=A0A7J6FZE0_CANSA|nr:hypothetical protein G4B88_025204 [Cannabis sativa]
MVSDSVANASIPSVQHNSKDLGKKKRARTAKLKQCKLDVRREQWLSQVAVKNKCCKEEMDGVQPAKERNRPLGNLETLPRGGENDGSNHHNDSDSDSPSNSPTSLTSSVLGSHGSGTNFTGSSSSSSSSSSSGGCCSGSITEEEEDDGCLDDWEAVADALAANDKSETPCTESPPDCEVVPQLVSSCQETNGSGLDVESTKSDLTTAVPKGSGSTRAWRPDDAFRPQCLPNLSKQLSLPNSNRQHYGFGVVPWTHNTIPPSNCPICCEDLDLTDTSFLPCLCGFRLCLFCHNKILEADRRCPGCRKPYDYAPVKAEAEAIVQGGSLTVRLGRSCSMVTRPFQSFNWEDLGEICQEFIVSLIVVIGIQMAIDCDWNKSKQLAVDIGNVAGSMLQKWKFWEYIQFSLVMSYIIGSGIKAV